MQGTMLDCSIEILCLINKILQRYAVNIFASLFAGKMGKNTAKYG